MARFIRKQCDNEQKDIFIIIGQVKLLVLNFEDIDREDG